MTDQPQGGKAALTVVIQSWWTPALALIALVVGLLAGYFGRPVIAKDLGPTQGVAAVTTPAVTTAPVQISEPTTAADPTLAAIKNQDQLMAFLVSKTIHFQGDPNAKVTLIEFSDYQ